MCVCVCVCVYKYTCNLTVKIEKFSFSKVALLSLYTLFWYNCTDICLCGCRTFPNHFPINTSYTNPIIFGHTLSTPHTNPLPHYTPDTPYPKALASLIALCLGTLPTFNLLPTPLFSPLCINSCVKVCLCVCVCVCVCGCVCVCVLGLRIFCRHNFMHNDSMLATSIMLA